MLVLHRYREQRVIIHHAGERLEIVVCDASAGRAKLGFNGPTTFQISRPEPPKRPGGKTDDKE